MTTTQVPRLALTKAEVVIRPAPGQEPTATLAGSYLHIRRGEALARSSEGTETTMTVESVERLSKREFVILGTDGQEWTVTRSGGCGCR